MNKFLLLFVPLILLAGCITPETSNAQPTAVLEPTEGASPGAQPIYADDASPVMYFYSDSCHFCIEQKPILEQLAQEKGYKVKLMNVKDHPGYWEQFKLEGTPTFIAANGDTKVGYTKIEALGPWLKSHGAQLG
ncbi:MAG: thioredoxin family protein [Candidatus Micrarchaeota archaeon]